MQRFHTMIKPSFYLDIHLAKQTLSIIDRGTASQVYPISSGKNGNGELKNSGCTPRGWHLVRAKIGADTPAGSVFIGRRPTGEIWSPELQMAYPERDWILTRILWLSGLEPGINRLGQVDTMQRFIYIHGTPPTVQLGIPQSHGCIRMNHQDLIELFDQVPCFTHVWLHETD